MKTLQGSGLHGVLAQTLGRVLVDPNKATEALGAINKEIFLKIYPYAACVADHGAKQFRACAERAGWSIPSLLTDAFDNLEKGRLREAANDIAEYEQRVIVPPIYNRYADVFRDIKFGDHFDPYNNTSIPLSYDCNHGKPIPFDGTIDNTDDRISYYGKLMNAMEVTR